MDYRPNAASVMERYSKYIRGDKKLFFSLKESTDRLVSARFPPWQHENKQTKTQQLETD